MSPFAESCLHDHINGMSPFTEETLEGMSIVIEVSKYKHFNGMSPFQRQVNMIFSMECLL